MGTYTFTGLPGVAGEKLEGPMTESVSGFMAALRGNRICSAVGSNGAVTVWKDDDGMWRCDFSRYCSTVCGATVKTKAQVREWLREWMPERHYVK